MGSRVGSSIETVSEEQVRAFIKANPAFLQNNPELMMPERNLGEGVLDFQHHLVKHLQKGSKDLKSQYDLLVEYCRDNMSVQQQVHQAVLRLIRTHTLDQLIEAVAVDMVSLFDVDVIRIAIEFPHAGAQHVDEHYSGMVAIPPGTVDAALGMGKNSLLLADSDAFQPEGFDVIFPDCAALVKSCALLRLKLDIVQCDTLLAFGVRYKDRFHAGQGIELLNFLAQIVAHQLDIHLQDILE